MCQKLRSDSPELPSGSPGVLLHRSPLRTVRESFPAYGSSLYETPERVGFVTEMC